MALPEDPRGSRRGQSGNDIAGDRRGEPRPLTQRPAPRPPVSRQDDQFASFGASAPQERANNGRQQPSFSNYRPEAYANEKRSNGRAPEQDWAQAEPQFRAEAPRPAADAYQAAPSSSRQQHHDPYGAETDPYDAGRREYESSNDWHSSNAYQDQQANQYESSNYYQHDEPQAAPDAQSMHDRFFSAAPEPAPRAPQVPQQPAPAPQQRYQANDFDTDDFVPEERPAPRAAAKPAPAPARGGFEDAGNDYRWDNFDQPPAPEAVRPFPNAKLGPEEDLDADYFADEEEFDGDDDDFAEPKSGGSKRLMAAVLVGAVVTGGGLAYLYKSQTGGGEGGEPPIMVADPRPIKEQPADPGGRQFSNGGKLIYDRLDGSAGPEEPTRLAASDANQEKVTPGVVTTSGTGTLEERIQSALREAKKEGDGPSGGANATNTASAFDTPRPVKTETIRPDGSTDNSRVQRRAAPAEGDTTLAGGAPRGVAVREAPAAEPRRQVAAVAPQAAAPAAVAIASGGDAGMFVQIAARNDEAAARAAFVDLKQKYSGVLGAHTPSVRKVDLGDKGVWFRLLVGPMASKAEADKLCDDLKTAGMKGCFSRKE